MKDLKQLLKENTFLTIKPDGKTIETFFKPERGLAYYLDQINGTVNQGGGPPYRQVENNPDVEGNQHCPIHCARVGTWECPSSEKKTSVENRTQRLPRLNGKI